MRKEVYLVLSVVKDLNNGKITKEPVFVVDTEEQAIKDCQKFNERPNDLTDLFEVEYIYQTINFYPTIKEG